MTPVHVLTGFLGSGKTTLLAALLQHPEMGRTAVIVNELGEIGIDHDLLATSDERFVHLTSGCLCCTVRSDLVQTLLDLDTARREGSVPAFERVVIETSGLADPTPIVHALMTDAAVRRLYTLEGIVTLADAVTGTSTLERYIESVRQVAHADCVVMTKTDRVDANPVALARAVQMIQPHCPLLQVVRGAIAPSTLFAHRRSGVPPPFRAIAKRARSGVSTLAHVHTSGVGSVSIVRDAPVHAATLALFVSALAANCGDTLLRMKGIVGIAEDPQRPAVVHGVQHVYSPPEWLPRWPSAERRTRIVCIGRGLSAQWIGELLGLLEEEVAEETALRSRGPCNA